MNEKRRYILGAVTITAVLGFTAYAIYEYKKVSKQMEEAIDIDQAKREVEEAEDDEDDEYDEYDIQEYENITGDIEEEEKLLHDPDSLEARDQFIRMKVAEWVPGDEAHEVLIYLFTFPFQPTNEEDKLLKKVLMYN